MQTIDMTLIEQLRHARAQIDKLLATLGEEPEKITEKSLADTHVKIELTEREREVFALIGQGKNPHEIAEALGMKLKTFNAHRENIRAKFKAKSAHELAQIAKESL